MHITDKIYSSMVSCGGINTLAVYLHLFGGIIWIKYGINYKQVRVTLCTISILRVIGLYFTLTGMMLRSIFSLSCIICFMPHLANY